jgi:hypothetical protein
MPDHHGRFTPITYPAANGRVERVLIAAGKKAAQRVSSYYLYARIVPPHEPIFISLNRLLERWAGRHFRLKCTSALRNEKRDQKPPKKDSQNQSDQDWHA